MRCLLNVAYHARRRLLALLRRRTRGVKVMAFNPAGDLLLIRHGYGRRDVWMLPGGGVRRGETPAAAAVRELMEEVGCRARELTEVSRHLSVAQGRRDTVTLFRCLTDDSPRADGWEVEEARFVAPDAPPDRTSRATLRRLAELAGEAAATDAW